MKAVLVDPIDADDAPAGAVEICLSFDETRVAALTIRCPGCRSLSALMLRPTSESGPSWEVVAGDPRQPETMTLAPSVLHSIERGGCGWHGYLRNGEWVPC